MRGGETEKKWSNEELLEEIKKRILARAPDFKAQASSLTFEGARRAVEKDLGMRQFSLDAHKTFIKRCLEECLSADGDEKAPEPSGSTKSKAEKSTIEEPEETQNTSELKNEGASNFDETRASDTEIKKEENKVSEGMISKAIEKRASYFKKHSETISLMKVRRLLEEDLKLCVKALDAHKAFISTTLEKVLASMEMNKSENSVQKKPKKASQKVEKPHTSKASKRTREESDPSDNSSKEEERSEVEPKRRKQALSKVKASTKISASQKNSVEENKKSIASSKSKKMAKKGREDNSDEEREGGNSSDKNVSRSSDEEEDAQKKREKPALQVYGKKVEHLKSIIKSCGVGIPPAVYRRAKQAPEDKREAFLMKELGEILEKEGLSTNPSEKEIKEVKKRKERAKELEGIDMSNIITSSRRRSSAFSYIPPPKPPKIELSSDDDDEEGEDNDDDDDDDDDVDLEKGDVNDNDTVGDVDDGGEHVGDDGDDDDVDLEKGDVNDNDAVGDVDDGGEHVGDDGDDDDGDEGKGSGQD